MGIDERLDGWKAIGGYFGRDRTTAIRWARDRGLPVRSMPGGRTRTVFALRSELEAWSARASTPADAPAPSPPEPVIAPPPAAAEVAAPTPPASRRSPVNAILAAVAAGCLVAAAALTALQAPRRLPLPADPRVAAVYIQARDEWGQRSALGLAQAIDGLKRVTRLDPHFAPAFASLADAYLVASEEGALPNADAVNAARGAADRAVALDPGLPAAQRALGYIAYWTDRDRARSREAFRAALRLDAADPQTHLWYASILSDNGEDAAAAREYDAARLSAPGSIPIRTERAWAAWLAGREAEGAAELAAIVAEAPGSEEAHDCLSVVALDRGDVAGYVREMRIRARLRAQPGFTAWVDALSRAEASGGARAALAATLRHAIAYQTTLGFRTDPWEAYVASLAGDRATLLDLLRRADAAHETWGMVGYQRRIARRWAGDPQIAPLLAHRTPPRLEA